MGEHFFATFTAPLRLPSQRLSDSPASRRAPPESGGGVSALWSRSCGQEGKEDDGSLRSRESRAEDINVIKPPDTCSLLGSAGTTSIALVGQRRGEHSLVGQADAPHSLTL